MFNFKEELDKVGLTEEQYEACLQDIKDKLEGIKDIEWEEIRSKYNLPITTESLRKSQSRPMGGVFVAEYLKHKGLMESVNQDDLDIKLEQLRKEKIKIQTLNVERNRLDRSAARQELFYEYVGDVCASLPLPDFMPLHGTGYNKDITYCLTIADLHYGADFKSLHNEYSKEIFKNRLTYLGDRVVDFVEEHGVNTLHVVELGDCIQGILRLSDLKINDGEIVRAVVEISRLLAMFLNELSKYVQIEYYHVPSANHTQIRVLGAKASEIAEEDLEYVVAEYIKDLCVMNDRIHVNTAEDHCNYIKVSVPGHNVIAMHGHQIKSINNSVRDISAFLGEPVDYLLLGHFHNAQEISSNEGCCHDTEVLLAPSFVGSDPYSDSIFKGSKAAAKIFGFDETEGHTESYKITLN